MTGHRCINDALPRILQIKPEVTVVEISGRLVLGQQTARLRRLLDDLAERGKANILLDVSQVEYLDSVGLGELVAAASRLRDRGARLKLCGLTRRIESLLIIAKLLTVFDCYKSRGEAMSSFAEASPAPGWTRHSGKDAKTQRI